MYNFDCFVKMSFKLKRILRNISKVILLVIGVGLVGYFGYLGAQSVIYKPIRVRISNITDSSATVSWVTDSPMRGVVYFNEKDSFLPGPLSFVNSGRAYDDRDVSKAQTECVNKFNKDADISEDFTVDGSNFDCENVKVTKVGKYYTHHVTLKDLNENTNYYFRVGDGLMSWKVGANSLKTFAVLEEVKEPMPIFGKVVDDEGNYTDDSLVYVKFKNGREEKESIAYSSVTNREGGWYLDGSYTRTISGDLVGMESAQDMFVANGQYQNYDLSEGYEWIFGTFNGAYPDIMVKKKIVRSTLLEGFSFKSFAEDCGYGSMGSCTTEELVEKVGTWGYGNVVKAIAENETGGVVNQKTLEIAELGGDNITVAGNLSAIAGAGNGVRASDIGASGEAYIDPETDKATAGTYVPSSPTGGEPGDVEGAKYTLPLTRSADGSVYKIGAVDIKELVGEESFEIFKKKIEDFYSEKCSGGTPCEIKVQTIAVEMNEDVFVAKFSIYIDLWKRDADSSTVKEYLEKLEWGRDIGKELTADIKVKIEKKSEILEKVYVGDNLWNEIVECKGGYAELKLLQAREELLAGYKIACVGDECLFQKEVEKEPTLEEVREFTKTYLKTSSSSVDVTKISLVEDIDGHYILTRKDVPGYVVNLDTLDDIVEYVAKTCVGCEVAKEDLYTDYEAVENSDLIFLNDPTKVPESIGVVDIEALREHDVLGGTTSSASAAIFSNACLYGDCSEAEAKNLLSLCKTSDMQNVEIVSKGEGKYRVEYLPSYESTEEDLEELKSKLEGVESATEKIEEEIEGALIEYQNMRIKGLFAGIKNIFFSNNVYAADIATEESADSNKFFFLPEYGSFTLEYGPFTFENEVSDGKKIYLFYFETNGKEGLQLSDSLSDDGLNNDILIESAASEITYSKTANAQDIELSKGVNILSFDFIPAFSYGEVFTAEDLVKAAKDSNAEIEYVTYFEGGRWSEGVSCPNGENCFGNGFAITPGRGYLVKVSNDMTVTVPGFNVTSAVPINLSSGWNLVGVHGYSKAFTARSFVDSINETKGLTADNVSWWPTSKAKYEGLQVSENTEYGLDFPISPLNGYFVRINKFEPNDETCKSIIWHYNGELNGTCGNSKTIFN
ncbi:MAG: fibronectin type III domain-containing protein [Candidatus Dojkabacteria bacterium]